MSAVVTPVEPEPPGIKDVVEDRSARYWLVAAGSGYLLSFALLVVSASYRLSGVMVIVWAICLLASSIALSVLLRQPDAGRLAVLRTVIPVAMLLVGVALLWLWIDSGRDGGLVSGQRTQGWGFFGGCLAIMGAGHLLTVARQTAVLRIVRGALLTAACAAAFVFGLRALSDGGPGWAVWLLVAGLLLAPVGLGLLTEDIVDGLVERRARPLGWGLVLAGSAVVAVVTGVWLLVALGSVEFAFAVVVTAVLGVLIGAIAANTPSDMVLVVAVLALTWANIPSGVDLEPILQPAEGQDVIVALGDSFMSGEGAKRFYEGTNDKDRNECRRAPTAYAPLMVSRASGEVPDRLAFVACSGARALDIYQRAQQPADPLDRPEGGLNQLEHVDWLQANARPDVRLVIVSIGGNDALFGDVAQACVAPGDCTEIGARFLERLAVVAGRIDGTYQRIRNFFGTDIPVLVVPYPVPLSQEKCGSSLLTEREHRFLHGFAIELNKVLARAASDAGLYYLSEMEDVFAVKKLRICDDDAGRVGVNFLAMHAVGGLVEQSLNPQNWLHNSLHPNERGHQAMAEVLEQWITKRPYPAVPADPPPLAERHVQPIASIETIMHDPQFRHCGSDPSIPHCSLSTLDWAMAQIVTLANRNVGPLMLTIGGLWAIWVWFVWSWRYRRSRRRPPSA